MNLSHDQAQKKMIFFVNSSISSSGGGRTRAIINRAKLLVHRGYSVVILSLFFRPEFSEEVEKVKKRDSLPESISFWSMFDLLAEETERKSKADTMSNLHARLRQRQAPYAGFVHLKDQKIRRDRISFINDDTATMLEYHYSDDANGVIQETWKPKGEEERRELRYYRSTDKPFLIQRYDEQEVEIEVIWYDKNQQANYFPDLRTLQHYWISVLFNKYPDAYFLLEDRNYDEIVVDNKFGVSPKSVATIHGSHFLEGRTLAIQKRLSMLLRRINKYDAIICLTHRQKQDILDEYGPRDNLHVVRLPIGIPTKRPSISIEKPISPEKLSEENHRQSSNLVMLSRLSPEKQVDHAIKAMHIVHAQNPEIKLVIYGKGKLRRKLTALIKQLQLEDTVILNEYTLNPAKVLQQARASILSSMTEGFSLSIIESLKVGTPCISYDVNYGPSEMIIDGKNGKLVQPNNIEKLAEAILTVFQDKQQLRQMEQFAVESISEEFSDEYIATQLESIFSAVDAKHEQRHKGVGAIAPVAELYQSRIEYDGGDLLEFNLLFKIGIPFSDPTVRAARRFFLRIPTKPNQRHLSGICVEGKEDSESSFEVGAKLVTFSFNLSTDKAKAILEDNPTFSLGISEFDNYAERLFSPFFISDIILTAIPYCDEQTIDCLKEITRYSHPVLKELRLALPVTSDKFAIASTKTIETALSSLSARVVSWDFSSKKISFEGTLFTEIIPDVANLDGVIEVYKKDADENAANSVRVAQVPIVITADSEPDSYKWSGSVSFADSFIVDFTPQLKKQYWKIVLKLSYRDQAVIKLADFKPFATAKAGFVTISSYQKKKVFIFG